ncbi:hypothetical protein ACHAWF_016803 [Thalassiosira exigua]
MMSFLSRHAVVRGAIGSGGRSERVRKHSVLLKDAVEHIIIIGGGIAGLSTARYVLQNTQLHSKRSVKVTLIDKNEDTSTNNPPSPSNTTPYEQQVCEQLHFSIPSRRNGNVLCPSLTTPWTTRSFREMFGFTASASPPVSFHWQSMMLDKNMWSFGTHFLLQKLLLGRPEHQSNKTILEYNMTCLDDASDDLVQSIDYGRWALGTKQLDGSIKDMDSSGDIGLFCRGLLNKLRSYGDRFVLISGEEATKVEVRGTMSQGVSSMDRNGNIITREADKVVVASGVNSSSLLASIDVPCPVYPAKGHLVTVASKIDCRYNLTLEGGIGFAAPMANVDSDGRRLYRLSGFVDFAPSVNPDHKRVEAQLNAARNHLPDLEMIDASACHRPISADDRPLIGPSVKYPNLYLCTGFGSRGWSIGLGSGKLLSSLLLGLPCEIDPAPYLPSRFHWSHD